ncbi:hypothetical protein ACFPTR_06550 [Aliibacillus thermotolerans]|uniref:Uncharacterized protein n=1 Tax=Aliibacillus thermotolerans TaxID=1834418 RepID=A0ABW0U7G9_9BACI|nr:hypothetical protein [Aliibacillus thermotolerans]MDA3130418.1 hypothetical protein [Aliibacillus thermotolerans]
MEWTPEKAYAFLQEIYTDELMQQEKRHVFQLAQNKMKQLLRTLSIEEAIEPYEKRLARFKEYASMPGDTLFWSMQHLFNIARGEKDNNPIETKKHVTRIYETLFVPAGRKVPIIPDSFWKTPLGIACQIAEDGIESVYPILDEMKNS